MMLPMTLSIVIRVIVSGKIEILSFFIFVTFAVFTLIEIAN